MNEGAYRQECLRSFPCFEVRGSSAHGDKILFFLNISLFIDKNYTFKLTIGKINIYPKKSRGGGQFGPTRGF